MQIKKFNLRSHWINDFFLRLESKTRFQKGQNKHDFTCIRPCMSIQARGRIQVLAPASSFERECWTEHNFLMRHSLSVLKGCKGFKGELHREPDFITSSWHCIITLIEKDDDKNSFQSILTRFLVTLIISRFCTFYNTKIDAAFASSSIGSEITCALTVSWFFSGVE